MRSFTNLQLCPSSTTRFHRSSDGTPPCWQPDIILLPIEFSPWGILIVLTFAQKFLKCLFSRQSEVNWHVRFCDLSTCDVYILEYFETWSLLTNRIQLLNWKMISGASSLKFIQRSAKMLWKILWNEADPAALASVVIRPTSFFMLYHIISTSTF